MGCIPSKALIHAAEEFHKITETATESALGIKSSAPEIDLAKTVEWKDDIVTRLNSGVAGLLKKSKVKSVQGTARFRDGKTVEVETDMGLQLIHAENIVIATGSAPVELPFLPFGDKVISSTEALSLTEIPGKLAIIGGGYIGLEIGTAYAKLGSEVTIVEALPKILAQYDADLTRPVAKRLDHLGITTLTKASAKGLSEDGKSLVIETAEGERQKIAADKILVTVGRRPVTEGFGLGELVLEMDGKFIRINDQCRTSMRGVLCDWRCDR